MSSTALRLVSDGTTEQTAAFDAPATARERLFAHWIWMLNKNPKRCALGPKRVKVIEDALKLYDEDTLMLAIEGCAASAWHAGQNDRGREFNDVELIFRDEAHIERFAADGQELHDRLDREAADAQRRRVDGERPPMTAERRAEISADLRDLAMRLRGRAGR